MTVWMLDTNIASHVIRGDRPEIIDRLVSLPIEEVVISSVTEGELFYGLTKRAYPKVLSERVRQFLLRSQGRASRITRHDDRGSCRCGECNTCHTRQDIRPRSRFPEDRRLDDKLKLKSAARSGVSGR